MRKVLNITRALGDENRLRALCMLRGGELCVCRIIGMLGLAPSTVSKHMSILKQAGLVETRRAGKWTFYRLTEKTDGPAETEIVSWVLRQLKDDPKIAVDSTRLAKILSGAAVKCGSAITNPKAHEGK